MPSGSRRESSSRFLAAVLCVLAAGFVPARVARADDAPAGTMLALDSTRSHADFEVKVLWLIGVHGRFGQVQGSVSIDRVRGTAVADAQIGVEMIRMRKPGYETWVKSAEFFDAQHHPQIHFVSDPFPLGELQAGGEIGGTLRIRDEARRRVRLRGIDDVDQVMRHLRALVERRLGGADVHAAIYLRRIDGDDLAVQVLRERHRQRALARRRRAHQEDDPRKVDFSGHA